MIRFYSIRRTIYASLLTYLGFWSNLAFAVEISADTLKPMIVAHVLEKLATTQGDASSNTEEKRTVDVLQTPGAPFVFPGDGPVQITLRSSAWDTIGADRGIVRLKMEDQAGHRREVGIPAQVHITRPVWIVHHVISAGAPLRTSDFALEPRDVSRNYSYMVGSEQDLSAYVARVNLSPGEWLDSRKIALPPDIRYNSNILILMSSPNGMTLSVPGIALSDGRIGQEIRVRQNLYQRKCYTGKILSKNQVLVEI